MRSGDRAEQQAAFARGLRTLDAAFVERLLFHHRREPPAADVDLDGLARPGKLRRQIRHADARFQARAEAAAGRLADGSAPPFAYTG